MTFITIPDTVPELVEIYTKTGGYTEDFRDAIMAGYRVNQADVRHAKRAEVRLRYMGLDIVDELRALPDEDGIIALLVKYTANALDSVPQAYRNAKPDGQTWYAYTRELIEQAETDATLHAALMEDTNFIHFVLRALPSRAAERLLVAFGDADNAEYTLRNAIDISLPPETLAGCIRALGQIAHNNQNDNLREWGPVIPMLMYHDDPRVHETGAMWVQRILPQMREAFDVRLQNVAEEHREIVGKLNAQILNTMVSRVYDVYQVTQSEKVADVLRHLGYDPDTDPDFPQYFQTYPWFS